VDNFDNKIFPITPPQSRINQADGPKSAKLVDLLRVTHQIVIQGYISSTGSKSVETVKQDLINIWKGAGAAGGVVTLTYDYLGTAFGTTAATDAATINGFIEKLTFTDVAMDEPSNFISSYSTYQDTAKFEVAITFIEGTQV